MISLFRILLFLVSLFILSDCKSGELEVIRKQNISFLYSKKLNLPEPSGLSISADGNSLWTVSDQNSTVYQISFEGEVEDSFKVEGYDIEGVTVIDDSTLAIVLERTREILLVSSFGESKRRKKLDLQGELNEGLEGITYNNKTNNFFVINEKNPRLLIKLNQDFLILEKRELNFYSDISGLFFDDVENVLWILSDENKSIAKCNLEGNLLLELKIDIPQPEGITMNKEKNMLFVVSDMSEELYVFKIE